MHISKHVDYIKPGISLSPPLEKKTFTRRDVLDLLSSDDSAESDNAQSPNAQSANPDVLGSPFSSPPATKSMPNGDAALPKDLRYCDRQITPDCIKALYDIPRNHVNSPENALGVAEFTPDAYSQGDLNLFFKYFAPYVPQGTHPKLVSIDGGKAPVPQRRAGGESDTDFDLVFSLVYPQSVTLYQVGPVSFSAFSNQQLLNEVTFLVPLLDGKPTDLHCDAIC